MKYTTLLLLLLPLLLAACTGVSTEFTPPPEVIQSTAVPPSSTPVLPESAVPEITQTTDPYPAPAVATFTPTSADIAPYPVTDQEQLPDPYPAPEKSNTGDGVVGVRVVNRYPHDPGAYTQGLVVDADPNFLLEGTGLCGESSIRRVELQTGEVQQIFPLTEENPESQDPSPCDKQYFGEGITVFGDRLYQLTWRSQTGFIYDPQTFSRLGSFNYPHEGWGITHDDTKLIVSDGTPVIHFWDPQTLKEIGTIEVTYNGQPVEELNELEFVNGEIWANVWHTDLIARISPQTGQVLGWIDLSGLLSGVEFIPGSQDVLNGIAYDAVQDRLFVTGKRWPYLFEVELESGEPAR